MSRPWIENEDGPLCPLGHPTAVKWLADEKRWTALCIVHTYESGWMGPLPDECPDSFVPNEPAPLEIQGQVWAYGRPEQTT